MAGARTVYKGKLSFAENFYKENVSHTTVWRIAAYCARFESNLSNF